MKIKIFSLLTGVLILQIISSFSQPRYWDSVQGASGYYPVQLHAKSEGVILHDTLKITWISPANETTTLKSASARIKATIKSSSGLSSVLLYLNDVPYGEPELKPSPTESGSFVISKSLNFEPGENTIYLVATNSKDTVTSGKRYFLIPIPQKKSDSVKVAIPASLSIKWINPVSKSTSLNSTSANIQAKVKSLSGLSSVHLYLNDVLYGEPEMNPSPTELSSFIISKSLHLEPGGSSVYLVASNGKDTVTSEKRYFTIVQSGKASDSSKVTEPASLSIIWTNPSVRNTNLRSSSTKIKATVKSASGLNTVLLYLNGVLYGEPELNPSPYEVGSFVISKSLNFEPGENNIYILAANSKDTAISEKRYFIIPSLEKNIDSSKVILLTPPEITWTNPSGKNTNLKSSSAEIRATVKSSTRLTSVTIYLNNVSMGEIEIKPSPGEPDSYIIEKALSFKQVENSIIIEAKNAGGPTTSETRYLICPPSSLTANKTAVKTAPKVNETAPVVAESASKISGTNPGISANANKKSENTYGFSESTNKITESPKAVNINTAVAPLITWTSPSGSNTNLDTYNATVRARIKSKSGLNSVFLYINGISKGEAEIKSAPDETGSFLIEKTVNFGPGENNIYLVATNSEGTTKSELRYFTNPTAVAPVITWSNPAITPALVNTESVNIEASIKSPSDLKSVKLIVNGETQTEDNVFQTSGSDNSIYNYQTSVILKKGENSIYINATNIAGSKRSEQRVIKYEAVLAEKRLALVIGNSEYKKGSSLKNPVNDANLIEGTLKELGFDVIKRLNAGKDEMMAAIKEFTEKLPKYNVALFYYAGHGNQVDGKNYLIPADALLEKPIDCKFEAIAVDFVVDEFERYPDNTNIVILDACRNNPYASWARGGEAGFKQVTFTSGTIIAFATSEGATAADGKGANGLYTEELVKQMNIPQSLHNVFLNTRNQVRKLSNNQQVPMEWDKLNSDFYLKK
jgi:Caspase domain